MLKNYHYFTFRVAATGFTEIHRIALIAVGHPLLELPHGRVPLHLVADLKVGLDLFFAGELQINVNCVITDNVLYRENHLLLDSLVVDAVRHLHVNLVNPLQHHFKLWGECFKDALELDIILCLHSQSIPD